MSNTNDIAPPPVSNPAPGKAAPLQPHLACNSPSGGEDGRPRLPMKLTRELLKVRVASMATILSCPLPKPDYDGFDDGDGADPDDGYEDYAAFRAEVDEALAESAEADSHLQSQAAAREAQVQTVGKTDSPTHEPVLGPAVFSFTDQSRKFGLRQESATRMFSGPREQLVAHLVRRPNVLHRGRPHLRPEHFNLPDEKTHQILVRQLYILHDAGAIPTGGATFAALHDALAVLVEADHGRVKTGSLFGHRQAEMQKLADELYGDADAPGGPGLLRRIFDLPAESLDDRQGFVLLGQFLTERRVFDELAERVRATGGRVPNDLAATLDDFRARARTFAALGVQRPSFGEEVDGLLDTLSEGWGRALLGLRTGMDRLDKLLGGLQGLTVLGAPPGTGKTVLVTQLGLGVAEHQGDNDAAVIFLVLDMAKEVVQARVLSHVAGVDYDGDD